MKRLTKIYEDMADDIVGELTGSGGGWLREAEQSLVGRLASIEPDGDCDRPEDINPMGNRVLRVEERGDGAFRLVVSGRAENWDFEFGREALRPLAAGKQVDCDGYRVGLR